LFFERVQALLENPGKKQKTRPRAAGVGRDLFSNARNILKGSWNNPPGYRGRKDCFSFAGIPTQGSRSNPFCQVLNSDQCKQSLRAELEEKSHQCAAMKDRLKNPGEHMKIANVCINWVHNEQKPSAWI
jgi:hypothetical protein